MNGRNKAAKKRNFAAFFLVSQNKRSIKSDVINKSTKIT